MSNKQLIPPGLTYLAGNITKKDNLIGGAKKDGAKWAKDLNLPSKSDTIFFAGCGYQYTSELDALMGLLRTIDKSSVSTEGTMGLANLGKKLGIDPSGAYRKVMAKGGEKDAAPLLAAVKILKKIGIEFGYLGDEEPCCGGLLYYIGMQKEFAAHSKETFRALKDKGVKRIIGIVPSCTYTLKQLVPSSIGEEAIEVRHFCEIVDENLASLKLKFPKKVKVTYHDPCQLGRTMGLIDEPRRILRTIENIEFVEPDWTKGKFSTCCGGGGGFEGVFPEMSEMLAVNRARELTETGAEIIVTHCPGCIMQLRDGLKELKAGNIEVLDLSEVVAMAMEV